MAMVFPKPEARKVAPDDTVKTRVPDLCCVSIISHGAVLPMDSQSTP